MVVLTINMDHLSFNHILAMYYYNNIIIINFLGTFCWFCRSCCKLQYQHVIEGNTIYNHNIVCLSLYITYWELQYWNQQQISKVDSGFTLMYLIMTECIMVTSFMAGNNLKAKWCSCRIIFEHNVPPNTAQCGQAFNIVSSHCCYELCLESL